MPGQVTMTVEEYRAWQRQQAGLPPQQPAPPPTAEALARGEAEALERIKACAKAYGWLGMHSWNAHGPDAGLLCVLVREVVMMVQVLRPRMAVSPVQQRWIDRVRGIPGVEMVVCAPESVELQALLARLAQPEGGQA